MQNDEPSTQWPPEQSPEQQPPAPPSVAVQGFPAVEQVVLRGWQSPPLQFPPQHSAEVAQAALSAVHAAAAAQTPFVVSHWRLQQSVATAHELPDPLQVVTDEPHLCDTGSHDFEQHWALEVQAAAATVQMMPVPPVPGAPACPPPPPVPVWIALIGLLPQPGMASRAAAAASVRAAMVAIESEVGEGLIPGQSPGPGRTAHDKFLTDSARRMSHRGNPGALT